MANEIITLCLPQMDDDIDIFQSVVEALTKHGIVELDIVIEHDTDHIIYRFQRNA